MPAQDPMSTGMIPPGVDPNQYYDAMRQAMVAQMLTQGAMTPAQVQDYGPARSRISPVSPIMKMVEALMARRMYGKAGQSMSNVYNQAYSAFSDPYGGGGGAGPTPSPVAAQPPPPPGTGQAPPVGPAGAGGTPGAPGAPGAIPNVNMPPGGGAPGMGIPGIPPQVAFRLFMTDPGKYADLVRGTPEWQNALRATGGDEHAAAGMLYNKLWKEGAIDLRSQGEAIFRNPDGTISRMRNPGLPAGVEPIYGPTGQAQGSYQIPGVATAEHNLAAAKESGEVAGGLHEFKTPSGGSRYSFGLPAAIPGSANLPGMGEPNLAQPGAGAGTLPAGAPGTPSFLQEHHGGGYFPSGPSTPPGQVPAGISPFVARVRDAPDFNAGGYGTDPRAEGRMAYENKKWSELYERYSEEASSAEQRMAFNKIALDTLPKAETGPLAEVLNEVRARAQELGIPEQFIPGWAKVAPSQEMNKALVRNAMLTLKPSFGARPAASEFQVLKEEANPSQSMVRLAIKRLLQVDNELGEGQLQRASDFDWAMSHGKDPTSFEIVYAQQRPFMARFENMLHPPTLDDVNAEITRRRKQQAPPPAPVGQ